MKKTHNKALIVSLKATGWKKKTNVTIFMKKLADFIINVKQVFKSIKIYLMKYKLLSHLSITIVNAVLGIKTQPLEFKTSPIARLHKGNSHYCLSDSGFVNQINYTM